MASFHMRTSGWSAANMSRRRWTNDLVRATIVPPTNRFSESVEVAAGQAIGAPPPARSFGPAVLPTPRSVPGLFHETPPAARTGGSGEVGIGADRTFEGVKNT
jgi:hypothetical protein